MASAARRASLALAATTLAWGSTFVVIRELVQPAEGAGFPPILLLAVRFAIGVGFIGVLLLIKKTPFPTIAWKRGLALGAITAGGFAFQTVGLKYTTASRSAFITNVSLLLVPLFGVMLGRAHPGRPVWAGCIVALGGLYFLEFPWDASASIAHETADAYLFGDLLTLGCAVFFACQILATETFARSTPLLPLVFAQFLSCSIIAIIFSLAIGEFSQTIPLPGGAAASLWKIAFLGLFATSICLLIQAWAQRNISATRAALIFMLEPVVATILAFIFLAETFTFAQWVGAALVFAGIFIAEIFSGGTAQ
ncbi:MAG: DMT family transporter [Planctomycetota bacterium]